MKKLLVGLAVLLCGTAYGGIALEFDPATAGPYQPGETVFFGVNAINNDGQTLQVYHAKLDFRDSDPEMDLSMFSFDLTSLGNDMLYASLDEQPTPELIYMAGVPVPGMILTFADEEVLPLGGLNVNMPDTPGDYTLSMVGADARIASQYQVFTPTTGSLSGGTYEFAVVPEPAMWVLGLCGMGSLFLSRIRRR